MSQHNYIFIKKLHKEDYVYKKLDNKKTFEEDGFILLNSNLNSII